MACVPAVELWLVKTPGRQGPVGCPSVLSLGTCFTDTPEEKQSGPLAVLCHCLANTNMLVNLMGLTAGAEEDRRERRRKLGLPEELTEEEKAAEAAKKAEAAKAKVSRALPVKPISLITQLRDVLVRTLLSHAPGHRTSVCPLLCLPCCTFLR
jgi:hypothetical protein